MAIPASKAELIDAISVTYRKLMADLEGVPPELTDEATLAGHAKDTQMSVHDLVAYLTGWGELVLTWHDRQVAGRPLELPDTGFKWNELGRLAQRFYADYADLTFAVLLDRFAATKTRLLAVIDATDDGDLYGKPWYEAYSFGRMIQLNTSSPYANARKRLRRWKTDKGIG